MSAQHRPTPAYDTGKPYSELLDDYGACSCTSSTIEADEAIRAEARRELEARLHALGKIALAHHRAMRETIPALLAALERIANYLPPQSDGGNNAAVWAADMRAIADAAIKAAKGDAT